MTTPSVFKNPILVAGFALVVGAVYIVTQKPGGGGPLDLARAQSLLDHAVRLETARTGKHARIDVVARGGDRAEAPVAVLSDVRVLACPKLSGRAGTTRGRYGVFGRTYALASFECLYAARGPEAMAFHLSAYVTRSHDPGARDHLGGHTVTLLKADRTLELMVREGVPVGRVSGAEQAALWAAMARHDIYVPGDTSRTSPIQRAMEEHLKRITAPD